MRSSGVSVHSLVSRKMGRTNASEAQRKRLDAAKRQAKHGAKGGESQLKNIAAVLFGPGFYNFVSYSFSRKRLCAVSADRRLCARKRSSFPLTLRGDYSDA